MSTGSSSEHAWLRYLADRMPAVLWSVDCSFRFTSGYGGGLAALGIKPNELNGVSLYDYFQTRDESFPTFVAVRQALAGKRAVFEQSWQGFTYDSIVEPLLSESGEIIGCVGVAFDVTDRQTAESDLRDKQAKWEQFLAHVPAMLYETAGPANVSNFLAPFIGGRSKELMGLEAQQILRNPLTLLEAIHPDDRASYYENALASMRTGETFDFEFRTLSTDDQVRWVRAISQPTFENDFYHYYGVLVDVTATHAEVERLTRSNEELGAFLHLRMRDTVETQERLLREVSERKDAEAALRKQSQLMDGILGAMPVIAFRINGRGEVEDAHGAGLQRFGQGDSRREAFGLAMRMPDVRSSVAEALRGGNVRFTSMTPRNHGGWAFDTFVTFDAARGQGAIGFAMDVTDQQAAMREIKQSEERWHALADTSSDTLMIVDADGRITYVNRLLYGLTFEEVIGSHAVEWLPEYRHQEFNERFQRVLSTGEVISYETDGVIDDVTLWYSTRMGPYRQDGKIVGVVMYVTDITSRKQTEQALRSEERLLRQLLNLQERDRRLLAYDIHDGFVQDVVGAHLALEGFASRLETTDDSAHQALTQIRTLLRKAIDEGRRMISELRPMIIDERGIVDAISYLIGEHQQFGGPEIDFHHQVDFQRLSPLLEGTMFRIVQEALNNVHRHSQAITARIELVQNNGTVHLVVRDDGIGFDPGTVPVDRFGLRGMRERARLFGGNTSITSTPGAGTEVRVELPIELHVLDGDQN